MLSVLPNVKKCYPLNKIKNIWGGIFYRSWLALNWFLTFGSHFRSGQTRRGMSISAISKLLLTLTRHRA
jgi:hypothetical protein